ncbi:MAG TPA: hypothetical protein VFQ79_08375 [Bryobacteraceae bacterium]|nr:hypothetical protein [Bryobacteraceae bacterium]
MGKAIPIPPFELLDLLDREVCQAEAGMAKNKERLVLRNLIRLVITEITAEGVNDAEKKQSRRIAQASAIRFPVLQAHFRRKQVFLYRFHG